jgi:AcrR family transcriptional regulator
VGRWEPDAAGRLREAALELFVEQGYDATTVADIADRAGLAARTFFRHFANKREVLFAGSEQLEAEMVTAMDATPRDAAPMQAVAAALQAGATVLDQRRGFARRRHAVIAANPELRERELLKLASLGAALRDGLRRRDVAELEASLAGEAAMVVFRVAFERWVEASKERDLADVMAECMDGLLGLAAVPVRTARSRRSPGAGSSASTRASTSRSGTTTGRAR